MSKKTIDITQIKTPEAMEAFCREHQEEIVDCVMRGYRAEIMKDKEKSISPTLFIVGGQNASGKSKLITLLGKENNNMVSIIIDDMKAHHPYRNYIDTNFPDDSEKLLHIACFEVFNRLFKDLVLGGYNIVIERTLGSKDKTRQFIEAPSAVGYEIRIYVTATHTINSLLSSLERFMIECQLHDDFIGKKSSLKCEPRPISIAHHDDTYKNICDVLEAVENGEFNKAGGKTPTIYIYDRTPNKPSLLFSTGTGTGRFDSVREAMEDGRSKDLRRCLSDETYGYKQRTSAIVTALKDAEKGSTLFQYKSFCQEFLDTIQDRAKLAMPELFSPSLEEHD